MKKEKIKIGYQGILGSNNYEVAKQFEKTDFLGFDVDLIPLVSSYNVVQAIASSEIDYGIVASKNSIGGEVRETLNALHGYRYKLKNTFKKPIKHYLSISKEANIEDIRTIYSHEQAFFQCKLKLKEKFPNAKLIAVKDTALAAKMVSESSNHSIGAICNSGAADIYDLKKVSENLSDKDENYTDFILFNNIHVPEKSLFLRALGLRNSSYFVQGLILTTLSVSYILVKYFNFDLMEIGLEVSGVLAFIFISLQSDKLDHFIAYKALDGYWKYSVKSNTNNSNVSVDSIRLCKFSFNGDEVFLRGWKAGNARKVLFESTKIYFKDILKRKGSVIYEYKSSSNSLLSSNLFEGFVFLNFKLDNDNQEILELEGRYISKFSPDEKTNADSGAIKLFKISKSEYLKLLHEPVNNDLLRVIDKSEQIDDIQNAS